MFEHLDRGEYLSQVLCLGYRFTDDPRDPWSAFVNRVKSRQESAVARAETVLPTAIDRIHFPRAPVLVAPILGSQDTSAGSRSVVTRLAASICGLEDYTLCTDLLRKPRHRSLHSLRGASSRDAEVDGKYDAALFDDIGVRKVGCVIVVDDLVTRGTTMNDAARAIRETNGNVPVFGVALAKTENRSYWRRRGGIDNSHFTSSMMEIAGLT